MPATRILVLARTRRCAIVSSPTRNARATASVDRPHTARNVSATWVSRVSAGWQQVKISRSISSSRTSHPSVGTAWLSITASIRRARCRSRNIFWRRTRSMALCRPTLTSQARGLDGKPSRGHCCSAAANASCNPSSASSKSPTRRISVARTRPASVRKTRSVSLSLTPVSAHVQPMAQIGRTSIVPSRAPGIRAAMPAASSRSLASIM